MYICATPRIYIYVYTYIWFRIGSLIEDLWEPWAGAFFSWEAEAVPVQVGFRAGVKAPVDLRSEGVTVGASKE